MSLDRAGPTTFSPSTAAQQPSTWHSPVPYLFGGLAAMLGLIAFALMILACSYWRLSGREQNIDQNRDLENGGEKDRNDAASMANEKVYEEKILVIMAGDQNPSYLATPVVCNCKVSSFGDEIEKNRVDSRDGDDEKKVKENQTVTETETETLRDVEQEPEHEPQ